MTQPSKKHLRTAAIALSTAALLQSTGCSVVNRVSKQLEGDWEIESWIIDGYEYMNYFQSAELEFGSAEEGEGDVTFDVIGEDNDRYIFDGEFELNDEADEMDMDLTYDGYTENLSFDLEIDGDDLELDGRGFGNYTWKIEAERQ